MSDEANKILVVDDSPQVCKALSDVLRASRYEVRTAPSAERALQIIETDRFDLVITDLKMSGMTGMDLAKEIFRLMPGVPVIILTGFGDMDAVIAALRSGVADFLKKPFAIDEVLSVVKRELTKSQARVTALSPIRSDVKSDRPPRVYIFGQRDLDQIETVLSKLRAQATAESALLVEQAGYVIAAKGLVNAAELEPISSLIAGARTTTASLASLLGEAQEFSTSYMEGQRVSVYTTALGRGLYLVVIVPKGTKQGLVWLYTKEAAVEVDKIVQRATDAMQRQLGHTVGAADADALHAEMAQQKVQNVFTARAAASPPAPDSATTSTTSTTSPSRPRATPRPLGTVSTFSFTRDKPTPDIVPGTRPRAERPAIKPAPRPVEPALQDTTPLPDGPSISFEEAMKMGLLGNIALDAAADTASAAATDQSAADGSGDAPAPGLNPQSFEDALKRGLLNFGSE